MWGAPSLELERHLLRLDRHLELGKIDAELVDVTPATGNHPALNGRTNRLDLDRPTVETADIADEMAVDLDGDGQTQTLITTDFHAEFPKVTDHQTTRTHA